MGHVCDLWAKSIQINTMGEVCCGRSENISTMKGAAHMCQHELGIMKLNRRTSLCKQMDISEETVIRTDICSFSTRNRQSASHGPHTRVDNTEVDGLLWEVVLHPPEFECSPPDVTPGDMMGKIDESHLRVQTRDYAFHGAYISILCSKICQ